MGVAVNLSRFCHKTLILPCSKQIPDQTRMFDFEKIGGGGGAKEGPCRGLSLG